MAGANFDQGGFRPLIRVYVATPPASRWEVFCTAVAHHAWIGRRRRVGLAYGAREWRRGERRPLTHLGDMGHYDQVFKRDPAEPKWVRIPGTGWCLATHRRKQ